MPLPRSKWDPESKLISDLRGGFNNFVKPEALAENESPDLLNVVFSQGNLISDSGYKKYHQPVEGFPQASFQFFKSNGLGFHVLVTTSTVYLDVPAADEWQYVGDGNGTTIAVQASAGETNIEVVSSSGFTPGKRVGVILDNGKQHRTTISAVPDGTHITLTTGIPADRTAEVGAAVVQAPSLNGTLDNQVTFVPWAALDLLFITNGVDPVKKFDGSHLQDLGGLNDITLTSARTMVAFHSHLLLMDVTEGGTRLPQRVRRSDTANPEVWNSGNAGWDDLVDTDDFILQAVPLGPWIVIVREKSLMKCSYLGDPTQLLFFEYTVRETGGICQHCAAPPGKESGSTLVVSPAGIFDYRGGYDLRNISEAIYHLVFSQLGNINSPRKNRSFIFFHETLNQIWFFYPSKSSDFPDTLLRWDLNVKSWFIRKFVHPFVGWGSFLSQERVTWNTLVGNWSEQKFKWDSRVFNSSIPIILLMCPEDGQVYQYDYFTASDDGLPIPFYWVSKDFVSDKILTLDSIVAYGRGDNILCEVSMDLGVTWETIGTFNFGHTPRRLELHRQLSGKSMRFRFSGTDARFGLSWFEAKYWESSEW